MFVDSVISRSHRMKCSKCGIKLPMGTPVVFELDEEDCFENVFCLDCVNSDPDLFLSSINEHPYNLED